jgi:Na+/glutamate symporter
MSDRDNFGGGFVLGAIVGGIVGGLLGTVLTSRLNGEAKAENKSRLKTVNTDSFSTDNSIENSRRALEDKIAQLNLAIDDVRHQLGQVNGNALEED